MPGGLTVLFEPRSGPGFALELRLPVGAAHDPLGQEGTAALVEEWLHKGAGERDARALADAFDDLGLRRGGGVNHESTRFGIGGLSADFSRALQLLADTVRRPLLPKEELPTLLDLARQDLEGLADSPPDRLAVALRGRAFGAPYAHPASGTPGGLTAITPASARAWWRRHYGGRGAVLTVVGELREAEVFAQAGAAFGTWDGGGGELPEVSFHADFVAHEEGESQQTHLSALFSGVSPTEADWLAFHVALGALSGGSASRLFQEVREERGLAYSVSASASVTGGRGFAWAYAGSTPERAGETLSVLLGEFERLSAGIGEGEFERARAQLLTATVFGAESARGRASALARDWLSLGRVRLPAELRAELRALTRPHVNDFLARRPFTEAAVMTLGPAPLALPTLRSAHVPA